MDDVERKLRDLGERTARDAAYREAPAARIVRRARVRRALTIAAPALAVVLFAGVALPRVDRPGERPETSVAMLTSAVDATEEQGSARIEIEFEFETGSEITSSRSSGVIDFETDRALLEVTFSIGGEEHVVETVTEGMRVFERPADSPDAQWREVDIPPGASAGAPDSEPAKILRYIESVASEVTNVGDEVRDGVRVTHYRAVLDPAKIYASQDLEAPEGLEVETAPMDVWVDEQGRVREATFGTTVTRDDYTRTMRGSVRFFDFGTPVDIELPDASDVTESPAPDSLLGEPRVEEPSSELNEFGIGEMFTVAGEDALSGPTALVMITEDVVAVCIEMVPADTSGSSIVEVESGDVIASVPGDPKETNPYARGGCKNPAFSTDLADQLRSHPELFELRFDRAELPDVVVPLTMTF